MVSVSEVYTVRNSTTLTVWARCILRLAVALVLGVLLQPRVMTLAQLQTLKGVAEVSHSSLVVLACLPLMTDPAAGADLVRVDSLLSNTGNN